MRESVYQARIIRRLKKEFPGCVVIKNDSGYMQGLPDLLVLFGDRWAMLEVKADASASSQPNQEYYVTLFDMMSYSAFIYPENEDGVFDELQQSFRSRRKTLLPKPK